MHDIVFKNATVYDGTGSAPAINDVAVRAGTISTIAPNITDNTAQTVDCTGLALMPGIIDSHTHFDAQITWDSSVRPSPGLGVTTAVIGNCGFTIAPCKPEHRSITMRNLTQVEGMSLEVLENAIDWGFETFPEYLAMLHRKGCVVNVAAYVGHSSVRTYVMGADAAERAATSDEIAQMASIVRSAMQSGAAGLASSTSPAHNGEGGKPMPSRLANDAEHMALIKAMGEAGKGVYMVTKGGHMPVPFLESMSAQSGRPVMIAALLHNNTNPRGVFNDLDAIAAANTRGHKLIGQVSCCPLSMDFTLLSPYPVEGLQAWKPALGKSGDALKAVLANQEFRNAVRAEIAAPTSFRLFNGEWDQLHITEAASGKYRALEQKPFGALAASMDKDPLDLMLDIALDEDLQTVFTAMLLNSNEEAVGQMLNHPHSIVSLSDAGAHLTFFDDAGFGLHLMGHWARELGVMPLQEAVRQLTSVPADVFGFDKRGRIQVGHAADLLLFDPNTVARGPKKRVNDLPGGAPRLTTDAVGVHGVWVNGQRVADAKGLLQNPALAGMLITEFANG
jgi:N-acyl-D-amino-acid deacylase